MGVLRREKGHWYVLGEKVEKNLQRDSCIGGRSIFPGSGRSEGDAPRNKEELFTKAEEYALSSGKVKEQGPAVGSRSPPHRSEVVYFSEEGGSFSK